MSKDTIYIEAPASRARRSAQTAMYEILRGLVATIAPILSFTAEEIYESMPGEKEKSVHLTEFPKAEGWPLADERLETWERILQLREEVNKVIEPARAAKQIGQSLEADITIYGDFGPEAVLGDVKTDLAKAFIVSHVDFKPLAEFGGTPLEIKGLGKLGIAMSPARGRKCGRCWNYREEVAEEGRLCARCQAILDTLAPPDVATA
jgi:isoleucyl-tRNA synthetase